MSKRTARTDEWGNRLVVNANKHTVSVTTRWRGPVQLTAQDARDIAHALLRGADSVSAAPARFREPTT